MHTSEDPAPFVGGTCFIEPPTWQGVAKQLVHLIQFSGGIQVVDGATSSGKTVFADHLSGLLSGEVSCGVLALPASLANQQVFECILESVGVEVSDGQSIGQSIIALRKFDTALKQEQVRKVLIVDDAHRLDDQALAALASIFQGASDSEVGLALVLFGEPGVAERLDALNLVDVEVRDCALPNFSLQETRELLLEEFRASFPGREFPLDDEIITALWSESAGRPGEVLRLAQLAWQEGDGDTSVAWWRTLPLLHVVALLALVSALIWGFWARDLSPDVDKGPPPAVEPPLAKMVPADSYEPNSSRDAEMGGAPNGEGMLGGDAVKGVPPLNEKDLQAFGVADAVVGQVNAEGELLAALPKQQTESDVDIVVENPVIAKEALTAKEPEPAKKAVDPAEAKGASEPAVMAAAPANEKMPEAVERAPVIAKPRPRPELEGLTDDERDLMRAPKRGFVIQVLAANSRKSLEEFVSGQSNKSNLRIYRSIRSGKSWFVVVEGYYADKGSALAAMSNLPADQLKAGPWPKSMAAVKLEIEAYKQQLRSR